ncbi:MAG: hypothetical protein WAL75_14145 [Terracidiphilus sp.]
MRKLTLQGYQGCERDGRIAAEADLEIGATTGLEPGATTGPEIGATTGLDRLRKNSATGLEVSGHDFSRADKGNNEAGF